MKLFIYLGLITPLISTAYSADNNFFFSIGGGVEEREFDKPDSSTRLSQGGVNLLFDLGYRWNKWELLAHSDLSGGHVEKLDFTANDESINGKFWYGSVSVGPVLKYHFSNHQNKKWNFFIMTGPLYQWTEFVSEKAASSQNNYGRNLEVQYHGMGGIAGLGFSRNTGGDLVDRMFYQLTYKQLDYRRVESDWEILNQDNESRGGSRNFTDRSIAFNVGMTFSDKLFNQIGKAGKKISKALNK